MDITPAASFVDHVACPGRALCGSAQIVELVLWHRRDMDGGHVSATCQQQELTRWVVCMVWYGTVWHGMVMVMAWYGMVRYGMVEGGYFDAFGIIF